MTNLFDMVYGWGLLPADTTHRLHRTRNMLAEKSSWAGPKPTVMILSWRIPYTRRDKVTITIPATSLAVSDDVQFETVGVGAISFSAADLDLGHNYPSFLTSETIC